MYSKTVGDFDVHIDDQRTFYRPSRTFESSFQTDLFDTKRHVGYIDNELKIKDENIIEEQQQEIITFRLPLERQTTEEIYETIITTETKQNNRQIEEIQSENKLENFDRTFTKSETTEWTRPLDNTGIKSTIDNKQQKKRSNSPEELIEESYEILSTLIKPRDEKYADLSTTKLQSSEDDSSYSEEWIVTEAKRKQDGQTVKTIIDR